MVVGARSVRFPTWEMRRPGRTCQYSDEIGRASRHIYGRVPPVPTTFPNHDRVPRSLAFWRPGRDLPTRVSATLKLSLLQRSAILNCRFARHPTTIAKAIGYANVGIALGRGIDRANPGFPLLQAQWAEDAPNQLLRGAYPHAPHPTYETADLAMMRQEI